MAARYTVALLDHDGVRQALFLQGARAPVGPTSIFQRLSINHALNAPGTARLQIDGRNEFVDSFEEGSIIEVWRIDRQYGIDEAYKEFEGFVTGFERFGNISGYPTFIVWVSGFNILLRSEFIDYYAGTSYAEKSGAGETVIKDYVEENIGPSATSPPRANVSGVRSGLTVETDQGRGANWQGSRAWRNLDEVIGEIAAKTGLYYEIVGTGYDPMTFEFRINEGQLGTDRTAPALANGLNAAGNAPMIFAQGRDNMINPHYSKSFSRTANTIIVLGQGEESDRDTVLVQDSARATASPWSQRTRIVNSNQTPYGDTDALEDRGDAALEQYAPSESLTFRIRPAANAAYGKDYVFGDLVTARYQTVELNLLLSGVAINVNEQGENINVDFTTRAVR